MEQKLIDFLLRYRYLLALLSIGFTVFVGSGAKNLYLESDYKMYFEDDEPHLVAHEEMEDIYTSGDSIVIMLKPADNNIFTKRNLGIIHEITDRAWQTPFVIRVDSLTNFQHTTADGEDLTVADLVYEPKDLDQQEIARVKSASLAEKDLVNRLVSVDGSTSLINVTLELPPEADRKADFETQRKQRIERDTSHPEVVKFGRELVAEFKQRYPGMEMHLSGAPVITNTFAEQSNKDLAKLVPLMYLVIILSLALFIRSLGSIVGTLLVIGSASIVGVASAAWFGYALNIVNITAPTIILTIAVCDSVHLLQVYLRNLGQQLSPMEAMRESFRLNLQPIILTSITTAVGFLTLNFSISPPFAALGNMTAAGVLWAMVLTFTLLPAITMLLVRKRKPQKQSDQHLNKFASFVVDHRKPVFIWTTLVTVGLISLIPLNRIDDDPIGYFKPGVPFRDASDFLIENLPGVKDINYSINCGTPSCVNDVAFLDKLQAFDDYLTAQPEVVHVSSYIDVVKRLNRSMNGDQESFYRVPDNSELSAQYNLMYEMSLPYGLDLNNQLNIDKSSTRVRILLKRIATDEIIDFERRASQWLHSNYPELISPGSSISLMFSHIGVNNINSMLLGGVFAVIGVTLTLLIALRSFRYSLISMIPNSFPAFMAFGIWGLLVGQVNMAVAAVFSISLGILVDDTVHFISKYRRARNIKGMTPEESIHYAFSNVGSALIITTVVLVIGFGLLSLSDFKLNSMAGALTAITIGIALIFDFLMLPIILMFFDRDKVSKNYKGESEVLV